MEPALAGFLSLTIPPRVTSATISGSNATMTRSLLCYKARLASKITSSGAAALAAMTVGDRLNPPQSKHARHKAKDGTQVYTTPGNQFPNPVQMDTVKQDMVCIPTDVVSVSVAP